MSPKKRARKFFFAHLGRVPNSAAIDALAEEFVTAEQRGEDRVVALVDEHLGPERATLIAVELEKSLEKSRAVPARDHVAQPAEQVTDHHRAAAPAEG